MNPELFEDANRPEPPAMIQVSADLMDDLRQEQAVTPPAERPKLAERVRQAIGRLKDDGS